MKSKHFILQEFVPKELYEKYKDKCWEFLDPDLIKVVDIIKEEFPEGTCTINNWKWGGDRNWSGIRTPNSPYYSYSSMHSWGKAVDMVFSKYSADEVRRFIIDNPKNYKEFECIKGIETDISWVHIDTRNRETRITFKP